MNRRNVHTVPHRGQWANVRAGGTRPSSVHARQSDAVARGRELARKACVEHIIHARNGSIRARNSYGRDPEARPG